MDSSIWPDEPAQGPLKRQSEGLRWRIVAVLLLVSVIPLALVGLGSFAVFGGMLKEKSLELHRTVLRSHARALDQYLFEQLRALELLAYSHTIAELTLPENLPTFFEQLNQRYGNGFVDLGVISEEGKHLAYVGPYDLRGRDYSQAEWFQTVMARGSFVSDVFLGYRQLPHCVISVKRTEGSSTWILRATINSDKFTSMVRTSDLGKTTEIFIVNREGRYQTQPRTGQVLDLSPITTPEVHAGLRDTRVKENGATLVQVTMWLNNQRWMLVVRQDEAEINAPLYRAMTLGALVVAMAMLLVVGTTIFATWHLSRQIDRANAQRETLSAALMRSARLASLGELAAGLAHEINNPLAIISAEQTNIDDLVKMLPEEHPDRAELLESAQRCQRQVARCRNITSKMLQFGRKAEARIEDADVIALAQEVVQLLKKQAEVRNVTLRLVADANMPRLNVDATGFEQVLANLVNNALDAIEGDGDVEVSVRREGTQAQIVVKDNGTGMDTAVLDQIFQPFFTTKPVGKGTGLGLSVCYGLVRSWNGTLEARSKPGAGTEMVINLPIPEHNGETST